MEGEEQMSKWWQEAIGYQIYPRSFKDTNHDGLGDINGIREKLSYLKELGVDFIWITPIYESPNVDNGYDISDYCAISADFGTMAEFQCLVQEAHDLDIKIIMDLVINHTSNQHYWFQESRKGGDNDYRDFYIWHPPVDGKEPNDWHAIFGGSVWEYDDLRGEYYFHAFAKEQPDLNWDSPAMRQKIFEMIEWWIEQGIDGFRIDAISHIKKDDWHRPFDFADVNGNYKNIEGIDVYLKELSALLKKHQVMSVGEANGVKAEEATAWVGEYGYFDMIFEFEHIDLWRTRNDEGIDLLSFKNALIRWQEALADGRGWNALYMENHDVPRSISAFGNDSLAYRTLSGKALAMTFMLLQGTPFIYQGQEIGMINNQFESIVQIDAVDSRNLYESLIETGATIEEAMHVISGTTRDNARTPMQWDASTFAGFSEKEPWLAINENKNWLNVVEEQWNSASIYHFYKQLIALRKENSTFINGKFHYIETNSAPLFCYERKDDQACFTIVVNLGETEQTCDYLSALQNQEIILANYEENVTDCLRPYEARLYRK
jgi:alpha-glucosidase